MTEDTEDTEDNPGIVAPPFIYLIALRVGVRLDFLWPVALLPNGVQYAAGSAVIAASLVIAVAARREFGKVRTSFSPFDPATALVTSGPYRFSRNPGYLALTLAYIGISVAADIVWMLALLLPALAIVLYGVIAREERYLEG